jgi:hypothetical protein
VCTAKAAAQPYKDGPPLVQAKNKHVQGLQLREEHVCNTTFGGSIHDFEIRIIIGNEAKDLTRNQQISHGNEYSRDCHQAETKRERLK